MQITAVSNAFKHRMALLNASNAPDSVHLVLEDDVVLSANFAEQLKIAMELYETNSVLFLGVPVQVGEGPIKTITDAYKVPPCCESYIVDAQTAGRLVQEYSAIRFPNNIQMAYSALKHKVDLKSFNPTITVDGSKLGLFASVIEMNNRLVFNPVFVNIYNIVNKPGDLTVEDIETADKLFGAVDYKMNPEFFYLKARLEMKKKNFDYALALYQRAYTLYDSQGTPLGQGSDFMRDYMKLYVHFQD
jgi:hypothetical protein